MRFIFIVCMAISALAASGAEPDTPSFAIEHIGLEDGLSNNFITDITQDGHGFVWIGTVAGLNRFDGENFKLFSERNTSLKGNSINKLLYNADTDRLWVGSMKGLDVLDCRTQQFVDLRLPENLGSVNIVDMMHGSDGSIYIVNHYNFIMRYKPETGEFEVFRKDELPGLPMAFGCIAEDGRGNFYIGHDAYGFSVVDFKTGKVSNFMHRPGDDKSLPGNNVRVIYIDRYDNIWVGTDQGLALFNPVTHEFTTLPCGRNEQDAVSCKNIYAITESKDGMLWIGSNLGGISILDIRDLSFSNPDRLNVVALPSDGGPDGLSSANIHDIFQDSFGNMWIGNISDGIDFISRSQPEFGLLPYCTTENNYVKGKPVWSLYTDSDGCVWGGGQNEVVVFEGNKLRRTYSLSPHLKSPRGYICAMIRIGDEMLLSSFEDGILSLDIAGGNVRRISRPDNNNYANCFAVMPDGKVYIGMQGSLWEYADGELRKNERLTTETAWLNPNGIVADRRGRLWIGTYGDGIFIFDRNGNRVDHLDSDHGLSSNAVKQLFVDSENGLWVAGVDGLSHIADMSDPHNIVSYGYESGLNDIHIRSLHEDSAGNIWFCTNNGIAKLDRSTSKIENYDRRDGLPYSTFMDRAACRTPDGRLYFGSLNGICSFWPEHFPKAEERVPVRIVECMNVLSPKEQPTVAGPGTSGEIKIPYNRNSLRIVFSVPDYSQSRIAEYSYMVEGLDNDWVMSGREHEATLRNLSPGRYVFKVRARLRNRDWSEANVASLVIVVTPPIWLTWYAKLLYALMAAALIFFVIRIYKHRLMLKSSLEMERRKSIDEQQLNNERLRFYTNITHELRTPLTLILGPLEDLVADSQLPAAYRNRIETIHASATRLLNLINQILEFRRTETQNRRLAVAKGQIATVVTEIGLRYKELNHNDKVSISLNIDKNIPEIYFDSDVIHTILNNFLSNAVKYTPEGSITLDLTMVGLDDKRYVQIAVSDTGYGIDEKALPHIFDRYYQAEGKHQASGTGIGLALVRSLADLHHGSLSVESKVGKGTVFIFRLDADNTYPDALHKESDDADGGAPEVQPQAEDSDRRISVLVVEDNDDIRDYISSSLESKYRIFTASNGRDGLELARRHVPDVIVSDIMMPVMDGMELCRSIKEDIATSHIPVILLTAKDSIRDKELGYEIGADSYLTKPFSAKLLMNRISNILESRRLLAAKISSKVQGDVPATPSRADTAQPAPREETALKLSKLDEMFLKKFAGIVEDNINKDNLDMTFMQEELGMSHSTLYRKVKGLTGMSGNELIRKIRLKKGYELLKDGCNVSEAAYSCGFNDVGYFRSCFKDEYGISPSQIIRQQKK